MDNIQITPVDDVDNEAAVGGFRKSSPSLDSLQARRDEKPWPEGPQDEDLGPRKGVSLGVSIHAGFPNPAADTRLRGLNLNQLLIKNATSTFMFRVRGEHGTTIGIFDGDIAIVDRAADTRANDYVLWHDGTRFNLSRQARIAEGSTMWGVITAVIHPYRSKEI